jgi:hypothetical protein
MGKNDEKSAGSRSFWQWADPRDPRTAVLTFLVAALVFGGGRKLLQAVRARRSVAALEGPDPLPDEVEAASEHGRAGLIELFRLLGTAEKPEVRDAAGRALSVLWAKDELINEEEKALVRRGFAVQWRARRRYPRGLKTPIPIEASYGVPFLVEGGSGVNPSNLVWSHRVLGAERAGLEIPSGWLKGPGLASFTIEPSDFATLGPHRLALAAKVKVVGLTDSWEIELPQIPFSFEFDPILTVEAILTSLDESRAPDFERAIRLEAVEGREVGSRHLDLGPELVLRDPPELVVTTPLPSDLAHSLAVEFEGIPGQFRAGQVVISGQTGSGAIESRRFPLEQIVGLPPGAIDRPGERKLRVVLTADPDLGWADPDVRSLWPGTMTTDWATVRVIRR